MLILEVIGPHVIELEGFSNSTGGFPGGSVVKNLPRGSVVKNLPATQENWIPSLGQEDPLEKGIVTDSSILAQFSGTTE